MTTEEEQKAVNRAKEHELRELAKDRPLPPHILPTIMRFIQNYNEQVNRLVGYAVEFWEPPETPLSLQKDEGGSKPRMPEEKKPAEPTKLANRIRQRLHDEKEKLRESVKEFNEDKTPSKLLQAWDQKVDAVQNRNIGLATVDRDELKKFEKKKE